MDIAVFIFGIVGSLAGVGALIVAFVIAHRQEKQQCKLAKDQQNEQELFTRRQLREQQILEICRELLSQLSKWYETQRAAITYEDLQRLIDARIYIETLMGLKLQLETLQDKESYDNHSQSLYAVDAILPCQNLVFSVRDLQDSTIKCKGSIINGQRYIDQQNRRFLKLTHSDDYRKQIEALMQGHQKIAQNQYQKAMTELGKVITLRLSDPWVQP